MLFFIFHQCSVEVFFRDHSFSLIPRLRYSGIMNPAILYLVLSFRVIFSKVYF